MKFIIWEHVVISIIILSLCLYLSYRVFYKKSILPTKQEDTKNKVDPRVIEWRNKHAKICSLVYVIMLGTIIVFGMWIIVIPFLCDMKYIITNDYPQFEGKIVNDVKPRGKTWTSGLVQTVIAGPFDYGVRIADASPATLEWVLLNLFSIVEYGGAAGLSSFASNQVIDSMSNSKIKVQCLE